MKTSKLVIELTFGVCLFIFISVSLFIPAYAQAPCEIAIEPIWQEAEGLRRTLEGDPFASAFGQFVKNLKDNADELERWRADAEREKSICIPYMNDLAAHESRLASFISRGCSVPIQDRGLYAWCLSEQAALESSKRNLDARLERQKPGEDRLNKWGQELLGKEKLAVRQAKEMLDSRNLENAFRLYAFAVVKDVNAGRLTSCEALAQMSDALGPKTGWQYGRHLALMGSVLASEDNPLVIAPHASSVQFTASGFRRRFIGPPGRGLERSNQVRHATAYLMAGAEFYAAGATFATYMQDRVLHLIRGRVPEEHDYLLGIAAGEIGRDLKFHSLSVNNLGNTLRAKLCGN